MAATSTGHAQKVVVETVALGGRVRGVTAVVRGNLGLVPGGGTSK